MTDPLEVLRAVIHPWHEDHFGHMNVRHYAPIFDDAVYHLWARLGLAYDRMLSEHGVHCVTARAVTEFRRELKAGDLVVVTGAVQALGRKSVTLVFEMRHAQTGTVHARYEVTEVVFDPDARRSAAMPPELRARLERALPDAGADARER